jgi:dTDP-4-amino-4,6-dideoxygalactose transaminase
MNFNIDEMLPYRDEVRAAVDKVITSGWFVGGPMIEKFEKEWAQFTHQEYAIGVGNGTDAIRIALLALGIRPGDEVLTSAHGVAYTALAIRSIGAVPVFVDIDPATYVPSVGAYNGAITAKTRAIVPVYLYGLVSQAKEIKEFAEKYNLMVVADAAQAHGGITAGDAHAVAYSFYPTKNLGALGEAGAITTDIPVVAERARRLRDAGRTDRYVHVPPSGVNSMLDEIQAAVLSVKLPYLTKRNEARHKLAWRYREALTGLPLGMQYPWYAQHSWHLFVVQSPLRNGIRQYLQHRGIPTLIHYPLPVPRQPVFVEEQLLNGPWPNTEKVCNEIFSLPMHADLAAEDQEKVISTLRKYFHAD